VARVTPKSIDAALRKQQKIAVSQVRELRRTNQRPDYRLGHDHSYQTQLLANLGLAIEDLNASTE
jgi:hypothetical protein